MAQQNLLRQAFVKEWLDMISGCVCRDQRSISPTFYEQPLSMKIPKAQRRHSSYRCLFEILGFVLVKAAHKLLVKSTPEEKKCKNIIATNKKTH